MEEKKNNEVVSVALREALERCMVALDDWLNIHASEHCDAKRVGEARARIRELGTIGYITDVQAQARQALSLSSPIEPSEQITKLANFIMAEIDGEPSQSEGAVDCAIRLLSAMNQRIQILERKAQASSEVREALTELCSIWEAEKEMEEPTERSKWYEMALRRCAGDVRRALAPSRQGATK